MKLKLCSLFIIFSFFITHNLTGADYPEQLHHYAQKSWRSISGLGHDNVTSLYRDKSGFVWAGTIEGITRIDGVSTKVFSTRTHPGLLNNRISSVTGSSDGTIYISSLTGISKISNYGKIEKVLEETDITTIAVLATGEIFAAKNNELIVIKPNEIKRLSVLNGMPDGSVTALAGFEDILYSGNDSGGIFSYSNGHFSNDLCDINKDGITSIAVNEEGNVAFGTSTGKIFGIVNLKCQYLFSESGLIVDELPVKSISYVKNSIRAVTENTAIFIDGEIKRFFKGCCNMPGKLNAILLDEESFTWMAGDKGITLYFNGTFLTFGKEDGLTSEMIYGMVEDQTGRVWVGTRGGGLFYYSDGKFNQVPESAGISGQFIGGLLVDRKGDIWVGTSKGIVSFTPSFPLKIKNVETAKRGMIPLASALFQDSSERIWAGAAGGEIYLLVKNRFALVKEVGDSKDDHIAAIVDNGKGALLFATSKGILSLENESFKMITTQEGLPDNMVLSLYSDSSGIVFAGTMRKGLALIMGDGRILSVNSRNGLCSDTIFSITKDSSDILWFTSTHGIFSLPFQQVIDAALDNDRTLKCFPFDSQDGIKRPECTGGVQPASMIRKDGSLWFPTVEGIAVSQKGTLTESNPHISIDSVIADGKEMELGDSINSSGTLSLLEIKFTASRFIHPERLKVNHILSSYENEWNLDPYLEKRSVSYQKVGAGNYSFKIETVGEKGTSVTKSIGLFVENDSIFNMIDMKWIFVAILLSSIGAILFINIKRKKKIQKQENINNEASTEITAEISETDEFSSEDAPEENYQELKDDSPKYEKSRLDDSIAESYANELKQLMEAKKPYKDPDLTLPELAKKLNLSTNILSQVINGYCCQNFYNFVNIYRAEEVIGMMKDPLCENRSILDLAYDAGFKSKTTFNTIFKKHTGLTPSEFRKNIFQNKSNKDRKD